MKKRLLVTISYSFSIRYIVRSGLLEKLREFCIPVIAITWNQEDLIEELRQKGFEVHFIPETKRDAAYADVRARIDIWFDHFRLQSPSKGLQQKYLDQFYSGKKVFIRKARAAYNLLKFYLPGSISSLFKKERELLVSHTNYNELSNVVEDLDIDAVFTVTPFHQQEDVLLRVCNDKGKKMYTSILSFDNLTKRGWIPVKYDAYMLWNKYNQQELYRIYPFSKNKAVHITGAVQFDFYFDEKNLLELHHWRKIVGIREDETRKIILYAGGPRVLFPQEPQILKRIVEAIENGSIHNAVILFRCHPIDDIERWKLAVGNSRHVVFDHSWTGKEKAGYANISNDDVKKLCSTLAYTHVHINLCSTMTVDGSAYNKPQIGPGYIENGVKASELLRSLYYQEHFLPILKTKALRIATSNEELINYINESLTAPEKFTQNNSEVLKEIITYTDGKSVDRVATVLKQQLMNTEILNEENRSTLYSNA